MKPFGETARETRAKASELAEKTAENARLTAEAAKRMKRARFRPSVRTAS